MSGIAALTNDSAAPASGSEGSIKQARTTKKGEIIVSPSGDPLTRVCMDGTYYSVCNPTMGTGIAASTQATFSATSALVIVRNDDTTALPSGKQVQMDYMRLICTSPGTGITAIDLAFVVDPSSRWSSGGTALAKPAPRRSGPSSSTVCQVYFGALTCTAASGNARTVSRLKIKAAAPVAGDEYFVSFGGRPSGPIALNGTGATRHEYSVGPISLDPSATANCLVVHGWYTGASAAASFECEFGFWER